MKAWENDDIMLVITGIPGVHALSKNVKTGPMAQAWVLPKNKPPTHPLGQGAVCGDCPLSSSDNGGCYVLPFQAPNSVYRKYVDTKVVSIKDINLPLGLRVTAFGEAPLVPFNIWKKLLNKTPFHTGYTHMWRELDPAKWGFLMASVHSESEMEFANDLGWSAFSTEQSKNAVLCINSSHGKTCFECGLCNGNHRANRVNVWVTPHGHGRRKVAELAEEPI